MTLRDQLIDALGPVCKTCGNNDRDVLQIDHIHDNASADKRRFVSMKYMYGSYLENIEKAKKYVQVLCANCNWKKRHQKLDIVGTEELENYTPSYFAVDEKGRLIWKDPTKTSRIYTPVCPQCRTARWRLYADAENKGMYLRCRCGWDLQITHWRREAPKILVHIKGIKQELAK